MPRRTTQFQELVYLIKKNLLGDDGPAEVMESVEMVSRLTGRKREVDIVIRQNVAGQRVCVKIECVEHERKADSKWVESMHAMHEWLEPGVLVLASKSGFYAPAEELARKYGHPTYTLGELPEEFVPKLSDQLDGLHIKLLNTAGIERASAVIAGTEDSDMLTVELEPNTVFFGEDGEHLCLANEFVTALLRRMPPTAVMNALESAPEGEVRWLSGELPTGPLRMEDGSERWLYLRLKSDDQLHAIHRLRFDAHANVETVFLTDGRFGRLGDVVFGQVSGAAEKVDFGVVATSSDEQSSPPRLTVYWKHRDPQARSAKRSHDPGQRGR